MASEVVSRNKWENAVYDKTVKQSFVEIADERTYLKEVIFAYQAIKNNAALQNCDPESIRSAVMNIALTGASLNPVLQQAFLIPRKGKACLDFGYRGFVYIAVDSGGTVDIDASVVYENDKFYYELGLNPILRHTPLMNGDRGKPVYVYAVAVLPSGLRKFIVLDKKEIDAIKKVSVAYQKGSDTPWKGDFEAEMWRKSAVKKLYKLLPPTERMSTAVSLSNAAEVEFRSTKKAEDIVKRFIKEEPEMIDCPAIVEGDPKIPVSKCEECKERTGCPAHEAA